MNTYIEYWKTLSNLRVANWCLEICSPLTSMRTISRDMIHCRTGHKETYHITPYRIISRHDAAHLGIAYHMHTYNRTCTYTVLYMSIYLSICVYIYIYIYTYIHTYTCIHMCVCVDARAFAQNVLDIPYRHSWSALALRGSPAAMPI